MGESTEDEGQLLNTLMELCMKVLEKELEPEDASQQLIHLSESNRLTASLLMDVLMTIDGQINNCEETTKRFVKLVSLIEDKIIPEDILYLELKSLNKDDKASATSMVRMRTKIYYKQLKFNLLREESEGYSKLITELVNSGNHLSSKALNTRILSLIGQFNLDPNRVCDLVLECFECCCDQRSLFMNLLSEMNVNKEYLCSMLGFKFTFYQKSANTPFSLYVVTAALVHAGLVDLKKICAFMKPSGEEIKEERKKRFHNATIRAKKAETIQTSHIPIDSKSHLQFPDGQEPTNIIGVSFATVNSLQESEDAKLATGFSEDNVLSSNQKIGLICALAELGSWSNAKELLDCMPENFAVSSAPRIAVALCGIVESTIDEFYQLKCASHSLRPSSSKIFPIIDETVQKVSSWCDLAALSSILFYIGPRFAYHMRAYCKLLRLLTVFFQQHTTSPDADTNNDLANSLMDIIDDVIVPGITLSEENCAVSEEIWTLLSLFPYTQRYRLYGRWKGQHTIRHSEMLIRKGKIFGRTRYVLKRLSKETVRFMGRQFGKLCHVHPAVVFDYLLSQVQTFDNLIEPVVDSLKYLSNLDFDVLSFCIMEQLAAPERQQLKASDGSLSPWLQSLATLVGSVYKKYNVELVGMLHYVGNQLKNGKSFDLLVLRQIVENMGGVEAGVGQTKEHLEAMGGGEVLRQEGGSFAVARNRKACGRLRDAILQDNLATGLCILVAQQRQCIVYNDSSNLPLKLACEMVDQCRNTLNQFSSFLTTNLKLEEYGRLIPSIQSLLGEYHINVDTAMSLTRPTFMAQVYESFKFAKKSLKRKEEKGEEKEKEKSKFECAFENSFFKSSFDKVVDAIGDSIAEHIPSYAREVPIRTFVLFWMLSQYDMNVPSSAYEREIEKVRKQLGELNGKMDLSKNKRVKEEDRLRSLEAKLQEEMRKQKEHVERVQSVLIVDKGDLFVAAKTSQPSSFFQMCILPRVILSELDAIYCATFIHKLHSIRCTYFNTILTIDKIFNDILPFLVGFTENEATALGKFMQLVLVMLLKWRSDEAIYDKECAGFPGFVTKTRTSTAETTTELTYESFQKLCFKYQVKLGKTFANVLSTKNADYVLVRNALVLLTKLLPCFPVITSLVDDMVIVAEKLRDAEKGKRDDLSLKAASYITHLKMRKVKLWEANEFSKQTKTFSILPPSLMPQERKRPASPIPPVDKIEPKVRKVVVEKQKEKVVEGKEDENPNPKERKEGKKESRRKTRDVEGAESGKENGEKRDAERKKKREGAEEEDGEVPPSPPTQKVTKGKSVEDSDTKERGNGVVKAVNVELKTEDKELTREKEKRGGKEKEKRRESNKVSAEGVKEREKERHESSKERTVHAEREGKKERGAEKETTRRRERTVEREKETDEERAGVKEEVDIGPALPPKRHEKREKERGREKEKEKKKKSKEEESNGAPLPVSDRVDRDSRHSKERTVDRKQDRKSPSIRERVRIRPLSISPSPKEKEHRRRKETSSRR